MGYNRHLGSTHLGSVYGLFATLMLTLNNILNVFFLHFVAGENLISSASVGERTIYKNISPFVKLLGILNFINTIKT